MKFLRFLAIALVLLSVNIASATSTYSDRLVGVNSGLAIKVPVKVAAMSAITLSGEKTIDDVACVDGDRVLVTANGVDSGIYIVHTGSWTRSVDWDGQGDVVSSTHVSISQGTQYAGTSAYVTASDPIVIGVTDLTFEISIPIREAKIPSNLPDAANHKSLIPITASDGTVSLWLSNGSEWKKIADQNTTTTDSPVITTSIPAIGDISGGYSAVIYGNNFVANSTVSVGGTNATIGTITSSSITITVPAHSAGTADIVVTSPTNMSATLAGGFTYTEAVLPLPVISSISSGTPTTTGATITFDTDVTTTSWVQWGLTTAYDNTNYPGDSSNTTHSHALTGLLPASTYHYLITVLDGNGNQVSSADGTFVTATPVSFPVISAISSGVPSDTTATITFTTDVNTDSYIEFGETTGYGTSTTINPTLTTSHSVTLTGLTSGTTYHYKIHVRDGTTFAETASTDQTFATSSGALVTNTLWDETVVPVNNAALLATTGTKFKSIVDGNIIGVKWYKYAVDDGKHVMVNLWNSAGTLLASKVSSGESVSGWQTQLFDNPVAITAETEYTVGWYPSPFTGTYTIGYTNGIFTTGVTSDKLYGYAYNEVSPANDVYNNVAAYPTLNDLPSAGESQFVNPIFQYSATGGPPVDSLTISNINVSNISQTSATINWTLSGVGSGYWEMGTVSGTFTSTNSPGQPIDANNYSAHAQVVNGLAPSTTYYYRVRSTNSAGVETISSVNNFTTLSGTVTGTPALVNPVNPMNYGAVCNGVTNDKDAFKAALEASDVLVPAGKTCVINGQIEITVSNKHIECGAGSILKQTAIGGSMFLYTAPVNVRITGDSIVNCSFLGAGTIPASTDFNDPAKHWNIPILTRDRVDNFILVGNTFDRFYGQAMFQTTGAVDGGHGNNVSYNTFKNCGYYGVAFVAHTNGYIGHNTATDCAVGIENDNPSQLSGNNILEYNTVTAIYGYGSADLGASVALSGGCTGNSTNIMDYHTNIVRNNAVSGISNAQGSHPGSPSRIYNCRGWIGPYAAQYINNTCTNGCQVIQP